MGWLKRIIGGVEAVAGVVTANPALVAKGGADVATSFGGGAKPMAQGSIESKHSAPINVQPQVPYPAGSLDQSRQQRQQRMKNIYQW